MIRRNLIRSLVLSVCFSALGLAWVIYRVGDGGFLQQRPQPLMMGLAVLSLLLSFIFAAYRIRFLCWQFGHIISLAYGIRIHILGVFSSAVTPGGSGGAPAIALSLQYHAVSNNNAWAIALAMFVADAIFLAWTLPIALVILQQGGVLQLPAGLSVAAIVASVLAASLALLIMFRLEILGLVLRQALVGPLLRFRKRGLRFVQGLIDANRVILKAPLSFHFGIQSMTALAWMSFHLVLYFVALSLQIPLTALMTVAWQTVVTLLSFMVPTPGGSGYYEFSTSFLLLRVANDAAVPATLLIWRILTYYLFFILGPLFGGYMLLKHLSEQSVKP